MDKSTVPKKPSSKSKTRAADKPKKSDSAKKAAKPKEDLEGFSPDRNADETFEQETLTQAVAKDQTSLEPPMVPKPKKKKKKQGAAEA